ncbi:helix-turn-helix domain-containing protein [Zunongwangia atlantica]|uniref:Helix-turn-helix domain-containing protein n=1 Tax=Zunongwangia atlantica 22II14-10F7 TaxID=1185767 RepID=A0A1Y1SZP6_9FLAO|nr:helix-turn-helix transcriptional regulator [Zunongwangia atlantica]ORL43835.1 helix-turn-helix domain-containing protein [Zunongwangia atlantica 22II14-10F7]
MKDTNRLDVIFTDRKITNRVIAKYLNKSEETVSRWRNNKRQPSIFDLLKIAELLREDIRNLLNKSDWSQSKAPTYLEFKKSLKKS